MPELKRTRKKLKARVEKKQHTHIQVDVRKTRQLAQMLSSSGWLPVNRGMMKKYGALCAIFMGQVLDSFEYYASQDKLQSDGSFFMKTEVIAENLGMSAHQVRRCKMEMKEAGVIRTIMKDIPPKDDYFLNAGILLESVYRINPKEIRGLTLKELEEYIKELRNKRTEDKEEIPEHTPKKPKFNHILDLFPDEWKKEESFHNNLKDYVQHRKEKGSSLTKVASSRLVNKLKQYSVHEASEALARSVENGWTGVFPESAKPSKSNQPHPNKLGHRSGAKFKVNAKVERMEQ